MDPKPMTIDQLKNAGLLTFGTYFQCVWTPYDTWVEGDVYEVVLDRSTLALEAAEGKAPQHSSLSKFIPVDPFAEPVDASDGAIKFDDDKVPLHLVPSELPYAVGHVLKFGAQKYAERNWEKGMSWSRPFGALMRHMWSWWRGEKSDPETGHSHLWHAACCIAFLIAYEARGVGQDDRPMGEVAV